MTSAFSIIFVLGALVLTYQGLRGHNLPKQRLLKYAAIWAAIIIGLVLLLRLTTPS